MSGAPAVQVAGVTGAASGTGRAASRLFAEQGASATAVDWPTARAGADVHAMVDEGRRRICGLSSFHPFILRRMPAAGGGL